MNPELKILIGAISGAFAGVFLIERLTPVIEKQVAQFPKYIDWTKFSKDFGNWLETSAGKFAEYQAKRNGNSNDCPEK